MLRYLFLFTVFGALSMTPASADANAPIIPYFASFNHFDHHWFEWMPKNPKYEAVEAMVADEPDGKHFVLVFLTERKAPKHQTFYTNDQAAGASGFGTYRDISYQSAGDSGMARSMHISLQGPNDARIDWSITFPNDTPVMAAQGGLTNQSGHSADKLLLLFYREKGAQTETNSLHIGSENYTLTSKEIAQLPFGPAYSSNIFVATLGFNTSTVTMRDGALHVNGSTYKETRNPDKSVDWSSEPYPGNKATLHYEGAALTRYEYDSDGHRFVAAFVPGLALAPRTVRTVKYAFSFDDFANLYGGTIAESASAGETALRWFVSHPAWATPTHLSSKLNFSAADSYRLTFERIR